MCDKIEMLAEIAAKEHTKNKNIKFTTKETADYTLIEFIVNQPLKPDELAELELPKINYQKGVVLSGRSPIWLYVYLAHFYHPTPWIATYDPRLGGAVVVQSHCSRRIGEVIPVEGCRIEPRRWRDNPHNSSEG